MGSESSISQWLERARGGDQEAADHVWVSVYNEVRQLARSALARERVPASIAATELAHDVFLRLSEGHALAFEDRGHLLATVARAIRRLLVDRARARYTQKRGGDIRRIPMDEALFAMTPDAPELIDLDEALKDLEVQDARQSRLIELRFFGGLSLDEAADALGISRRTVAADWALARAWLRRRLGEAS